MPQMDCPEKTIQKKLLVPWMLAGVFLLTIPDAIHLTVMELPGPVGKKPYRDIMRVLGYLSPDEEAACKKTIWRLLISKCRNTL